MKKLSFFGGAKTVTGANYLLELDDTKIIVDCGMFQGDRYAEEHNHQPFPYDPSTIDYTLITHAHADHIGRLPKFYKDGFRNTIISTPPTHDLTAVMLDDALRIMKHECEQHNTPELYCETDVKNVLSLFKTHLYNETFTLGKKNDITVTLRDAGHILGSAMVEIEYQGTKIVFTGDLGNSPAPLLDETYHLEDADYVVMESVYGNRFHETHLERKIALERAIENTVTKKGALIMPVFALERTQEVLAELDELVENNRVPRIPVFLDSPLAIHATAVYKKYGNYFNKDAQKIIKGGDGFFQFPGLTFSETHEDSKKINNVPSPKLIMAGNPHGYGSRIAHHFLRYLPHERNTVVFVGYARVSSLGRRLCEGAREVHILGQQIPVRAEIINISGYSSHADQTQLRTFVSRLKRPVKNIFVAMGEPESSETLARVIRDEVGIKTTVPNLGDVVELE